jgi:hypothetical protein
VAFDHFSNERALADAHADAEPTLASPREWHEQYLRELFNTYSSLSEH